jgi:hypothetical protein
LDVSFKCHMTFAIFKDFSAFFIKKGEQGRWGEHERGKKHVLDTCQESHFSIKEKVSFHWCSSINLRISVFHRTKKPRHITFKWLVWNHMWHLFLSSLHTVSHDVPHHPSSPSGPSWLSPSITRFYLRMALRQPLPIVYNYHAR